MFLIVINYQGYLLRRCSGVMPTTASQHHISPNTKRNPNPSPTGFGFGFLLFGAGDGNRTRTVAHTPLKRARLPVPPLPHRRRICGNANYYTRFRRKVKGFSKISL